jgi:hypothetical protein
MWGATDKWLDAAKAVRQTQQQAGYTRSEAVAYVARQLELNPTTLRNVVDDRTGFSRGRKPKPRKPKSDSASK